MLLSLGADCVGKYFASFTIFFLLFNDVRNVQYHTCTVYTEISSRYGCFYLEFIINQEFFYVTGVFKMKMRWWHNLRNWKGASVPENLNPAKPHMYCNSNRTFLPRIQVSDYRFSEPGQKLSMPCSGVFFRKMLRKNCESLLLFFPRKGFPSYFSSAEWNSEIFLFRGTTWIPSELTIFSSIPSSAELLFVEYSHPYFDYQYWKTRTIIQHPRKKLKKEIKQWNILWFVY